MSKNYRKPGFTYVETLVSILCIVIFITGYQNFNLYSFKQRNNIKIFDELQNIASFVSQEMQLFTDEELFVVNFKDNSSEYMQITNDQQVQAPKSLEDANGIYLLNLPVEYLDDNYKVMISRSMVGEYEIIYYLYHVIVFTNDEKMKAYSSFQKRYFP
ncbi:MAG: hypothetical protein KAH01_05300 [Caldisericia bacterium]|nr:hypothetical protein [Caldisericia bacterium]